MQEYYKIYFPYSKEYLLEQIKKTTKPLCISNQAYRDMALAAYKEEDNTLCIGYAAGSMTGGGWEMLQTHIKSYGGDVMLEGTFVLLPYIKKAALFFLLIVILFALFFSQGDLLILTECLILFMFPLYLLYRNISKIGKCEEGRRLVLLYLENSNRRLLPRFVRPEQGSCVGDVILWLEIQPLMLFFQSIFNL